MLKPRMCATSCWMVRSGNAMPRYGRGVVKVVLWGRGKARADARDMPKGESGPATSLFWAICQASPLSVLTFISGK